jgi:GNAT superfamily N-acetyltransferase
VECFPLCRELILRRRLVSCANGSAVFLRGSDGSRTGGLYGWVWGSTCYVRYLFVAESLRKQGQGTRLMRAVEAEARARNCRQIVLETHSFQAPGFYRKLGFDELGHYTKFFAPPA